MTKSKNTKRALLMSVLSMMLCIAMLAGSTFAWFTDSVTSGKNRIVAGNLDVELYYKNASTNDWKDASKEKTENPSFFVDKNGERILWEPGVMAVTQFKVANVGTLALKYALATLKQDFNTLKDENGNLHNLSEVIKFATIENKDYTEGTTTREAILALNPKFDDFTGFTAKGHLLPKGEEIFTVVAYWEPYNVNAEGKANHVPDNYLNANNEKQICDENGVAVEDAKELYINIDIQLNATQYTYEEDSFGDDYDKNADVYGLIGSDARVDQLVSAGYAPAATADDLANALSEGKNVVLTEDITVSNSVLTAAEGAVIDGNGNKLIGLATDNEHQGLQLAKNVEYRNIEFALEKGWGVITKSAKFYNCTFNAASPYFVPTAGGDVVVDGCTFIDTILQICYNEGEKTDPATINTIITNNKFVVKNTSNTAHAMVLAGGSPEFWASGAETVTVKGNTFTPRNSEITYIAYYIYGAKTGNVEDGNLNALTSVPVYSDNTFNGDANYSMNGTADKYQYPLSRESGIMYDKKAESVYISSAKGLIGLSGLYETLPLLGGDRHYQVYLTADIDMSGYVWTPFNYGGVMLDFNGQGHTISNLNCGMEASGRSGFIAWFGNGKIENLTFENVTAAGTQAGIIAGNAEGWALKDVTIKGKNSISYQRDESLEYQEEWNAIGAIFGYSHKDGSAGSGVIIAEGATIELNYNNITTKAEYVDVYSYGNSVAPMVTNNGTITESGRNG